MDEHIGALMRARYLLALGRASTPISQQEIAFSRAGRGSG